MALKVITSPTTEPITLAEAKEHLRIDFTDDDSYVTALISAARDYAEGVQKRSLAQQTLELTLDTFPSKIQLQRGPVQSVTSVKYTKSDGTAVTMATADYQVTTSEDIVAVNGWPGDALLPADGVQVRYEAGYQTIPPSTKQAMLLMIGHWYENREAVIIGKTAQEIPMAAQSLLWLDRTW